MPARTEQKKSYLTIDIQLEDLFDDDPENEVAGLSKFIDELRDLPGFCEVYTVLLLEPVDEDGEVKRDFVEITTNTNLENLWKKLSDTTAKNNDFFYFYLELEEQDDLDEILMDFSEVTGKTIGACFEYKSFGWILQTYCRGEYDSGFFSDKRNSVFRAEGFAKHGIFRMETTAMIRNGIRLHKSDVKAASNTTNRKASNKQTMDIYIHNNGAKVKTIKSVQVALGVDIKSAKALVDDVFHRGGKALIKSKISKKEAEELKEKLEAGGAKCSCERS